MSKLNYKKNDNSILFKTLEKKDMMNISNLQNYIPIYEKFFEVNGKNYNSINLNHKYQIFDIKSKTNNNIFECNTVNINNDNDIQKKQIFFKYSPLLDPLKYMIGKFESYDGNIFQLPNKNTNCHKKILDTNNSAYVDGFFSYLTSNLLNDNSFIHGIDFHGLFLGIKNDFKASVTDELDILNDSDFFHKNKNNIFHIDDNIDNEFINSDSRKYKNNIKITDDIENISISSFNNDTEYKEIFTIFSNNESDENKDIKKNNEKDEIFRSPIIKNLTKSSSSSSCSSRSSYTSNEEENNDVSDSSNNKLTFENLKRLHKSHKSQNNNNESSDSESDKTNNYSYSDSNSCDSIFTTINTFPVCVIGLEKCENTLDSLIMNNETNEITFYQWKSILMQTIMSLITYQKVFNFTHNDLHTNNIMYQKTDKEFLYYRFNESYYKVPTFGKIFKIIDFGRAIYKFKGNLFCSDSFGPDGDATTQYNIKPYLNTNKPILEPNNSFDLCRLACSLFDFFFDDIDEAKNLKCRDDPIGFLINEWCTDDKGRNILYKNNNEERYPDFKLYKMIARTVHNHIPEKQLENPIFGGFQVSRKKIPKKAKIIDIDKIPILI